MDVFILDSSKLNEIMYNMENQNKDSSIIIATGEIIYPKKDDDIDTNKLYPLPTWGPVEGFKIMNEFVSGLKNPMVKQELKIVLNQGHGVFRKFKNVLKESTEIERIWYSFKKEAIKAKVLNWYNQIREYAGLELFLEEDFEDEQDLLDFDFAILKAEPSEFDFIQTCDKKGFEELYSNYPVEVITDMYNKKREGMLNNSMFDSDYIFIAKTPSGESVGIIWAAGYALCDSFSGMDLLQLYVIPEYRGLGIGKILLNKILNEYRDGDFKDFIVNCQGKNSWLITYLELEGYNLAFQELSFRL